MNTAVLNFLFFVSILFLSCEFEAYSQGKKLYRFYCANCHMEDGSGLAAVQPPLAGADYLRENQSKIPCIIQHGLSGPIVVNGVAYNQKMDPVPNLSDVEITNIINYINTAWGNDIPVMTIKEIRDQLENCAEQKKR